MPPSGAGANHPGRWTYTPKAHVISARPTTRSRKANSLPITVIVAPGRSERGSFFFVPRVPTRAVSIQNAVGGWNPDRGRLRSGPRQMAVPFAFDFDEQRL